MRTCRTFVFPLVLVVVCACAAADTFPVNGDCESLTPGQPGWVYFHSFGNVPVLTNEDASQGAGSLKFVCTSGDGGGFVLNAGYTTVGTDSIYLAVPQWEYRLNWDAKKLTGFVDGGDVTIQIRFLDADYVPLETLGVPGAYVNLPTIPSTENTWQSFQGNIVAPEGAAYWEVIPYIGYADDASTTDGTLYLDNFVMTNLGPQGTVLSPAHISAAPSQGIPDRDGHISGDWAFSLWAVLAVDGSGLDAYGQHGTTDTGTMYMNDNGLITTGHPVGINNTYRAYVNAMFDNTYYISWLHVWNFNAPSPTRGFQEVDIHASYDYGQTYLLLGTYTFDLAPGTPDYTGFYVDIPNRYYTDIVISAKNNHGDASWIGLAEVQFIQTTPQPGPAQLVLPYHNGSSYSEGSLIWEDGTMGPFDSYDVYLGIGFEEVSSADNTPCSSLIADIDGDCRVDIADLHRIANCWTAGSACDPDADLWADGVIDIRDIAVLGMEWQEEGSPCFRGNQTAQSYDFQRLPEGTWYWRIDEYQAQDPEPIRGDVWTFEVVPRKFVNFMGWTELEQYQSSYRNSYAVDMANMGVRYAMDRDYAMTNYFYPNGVEVFLSYYGQPTPASIARQFKYTPGNAGYFQYDEPGQEIWDTVAYYHNECRMADPGRPSYTNLKSSHAISYYDSYVTDFINTVNPEILSFDCYAYRYGFNHHWKSLEIAREKSLAAGIPLWNWHDTNQTTQYNHTTAPYVGSALNKTRMRVVIYSSLAYGVKGICWFNIEMCFDIQPNTDPSSYTQRTYTLKPAYDDVADISDEVNRVGDVMVNLTSTAVYHKNAPSSYCTELPGSFWVQLSGTNQILGMFEDIDGREYAMVQNRSDSSSITTNVSFSQTVDAIEIFNELTGNWESLTLYGSPGSQYVQVYLGPGYGKLLRINQP